MKIIHHRTNRFMLISTHDRDSEQELFIQELIEKSESSVKAKEEMLKENSSLQEENEQQVSERTTMNYKQKELSEQATSVQTSFDFVSGGTFTLDGGAARGAAGGVGETQRTYRRQLRGS